MINRFFADTLFEENQIIILSEEEHRHLKVMRKREGDYIEMVNGRNQLASAQIKSISQVIITKVDTFESPKRQVTLAQALLKPKNLDLVIEKGTELGASAFWLFPAQQSEKKDLTPTQKARLRNLAISALKQCGRLDLPDIQIKPHFTDWTDYPKNAYFGNPRANKQYDPPSSADVLLFVGPEKGFTSWEEQQLTQIASGVKIHPNILRAETASLCFLSLSSK